MQIRYNMESTHVLSKKNYKEECIMSRVTKFLERFKNPERYKDEQEKARLKEEENLRVAEALRKAAEEAEKEREKKQGKD